MVDEMQNLTFCMALFPGARLAVLLARWQCLFPSLACLFHLKFIGAIFFSIARACFAALTTLGVLRPVAQQVNDHPFDCFNTIKILSE